MLTFSKCRQTTPNCCITAIPTSLYDWAMKKKTCRNKVYCPYSLCLSLSLSGIPGKKCGTIIFTAEELSNCRVSIRFYSLHTHA